MPSGHPENFPQPPGNPFPSPPPPSASSSSGGKRWSLILLTPSLVLLSRWAFLLGPGGENKEQTCYRNPWIGSIGTPLQTDFLFSFIGYTSPGGRYTSLYPKHHLQNRELGITLWLTARYGYTWICSSLALRTSKSRCKRKLISKPERGAEGCASESGGGREDWRTAWLGRTSCRKQSRVYLEE